MPRTRPKSAAHSILEDLPFRLARAALDFRRFNDRTLRAVGVEDLAPGLASVLHAVEEAGGCTVNHLVAQTHLPNGTLTGLLDTLEREGRIRRQRNPDDGRSWLVELTPVGRVLCEKLHGRHNDVMKVFEDAFSEAEIAELSRLLSKASACMREHHHGRGKAAKAPGPAKPRPRGARK